MATKSRQAGNDMVPRLDVGDGGTDGFNHACAFMAQYGWQWIGVAAILEV
jgi:hypothetical protein